MHSPRRDRTRGEDGRGGVPQAVKHHAGQPRRLERRIEFPLQEVRGADRPARTRRDDQRLSHAVFRLLGEFPGAEFSCKFRVNANVPRAGVGLGKLDELAMRVLPADMNHPPPPDRHRPSAAQKSPLRASPWPRRPTPRCEYDL